MYIFFKYAKKKCKFKKNIDFIAKCFCNLFYNKNGFLYFLNVSNNKCLNLYINNLLILVIRDSYEIQIMKNKSN